MMVTPRVRSVPHMGCSPHSPQMIHTVIADGPDWTRARHVTSEREAVLVEQHFREQGATSVRRQSMTFRHLLDTRGFKAELRQHGIDPYSPGLTAREACAVLNERPHCR